MCSLCILTIRNISYFSRFGFEGWICVLIASVPDLCILFNCTIYVAKTVTAQLICDFVFAHAKSKFSHGVFKLSLVMTEKTGF